ncbi:hypothetical protein GLYMA_19G042800v4 [Glycine max]|uniref:Uncharacterized protein n=1 Tax=Glycine max TaxID=3847 RepID=A0A0R0ERK3_SOYBN|nr:hypothetical protein GYH30_052015 [Glycine max]KRG93810.1 hypothetical protein GLYMA_19G042800v4 [Glycine max]
MAAQNDSSFSSLLVISSIISHSCTESSWSCEKLLAMEGESTLFKLRQCRIFNLLRFIKPRIPP